MTRKFSKQRELILNQVKNNPVHPTADEVYTALKKDNPALSMGTVYRNLKLLSETGALKRIHIDGSPERFDARTDSHSHLICGKCGMVFDVEGVLPEGIENRVFELHGHVVTETALNFKGVCRKCSEE
ncbi:MAG: transcriptional repressor [Lachnospiraceae bacterium]|nr:transcriptional repressor [Ruminococcus sp.]MCM1274544.1 transcriptional repressor [Lachnospiraceae bacterium]